MPKGTAVERLYQALRSKRYSQQKAAKIAQAKTGLSLKTGRKPKHRR